MLFLLQVAAELPPLRVTLMEPAPPAGLPEWIKILITAAIGALLGITSSIAMEFLKPYITKKLQKRTVAAQLASEFLFNLNKVEAAQRLMNSATEKKQDDQEYAMTLASLVVRGMERDRWDFNFEKEKALVYEIDQSRLLSAFYKSAQTLPEMLAAKRYADAKRFISMTADLGRTYLAEKKLVYQPGPEPIESAFTAMAMAASIIVTPVPAEAPPEAEVNDRQGSD